MSDRARARAGFIALGLAGVAVFAALVWVSVTSNGVPNPGAGT